MKITKEMVAAAHEAFHVEWWGMEKGSVCTDTCDKHLNRAIRIALKAALSPRGAQEKP